MAGRIALGHSGICLGLKANKKHLKSFPEAEDLAEALDPFHTRHEDALLAMKEIEHLRWSLVDWLGEAGDLFQRKNDLLFVSYQESLSDDFALLKDALRFPRHVSLPTDAKRMNLGEAKEKPAIGPKAVAALRAWYAKDYELITACGRLRDEFGGAVNQAALRRD